MAGVDLYAVMSGLGKSYGRDPGPTLPTAEATGETGLAFAPGRLPPRLPRPSTYTAKVQSVSRNVSPQTTAGWPTEGGFNGPLGGPFSVI